VWGSLIIAPSVITIPRIPRRIKHGILKRYCIKCDQINASISDLGLAILKHVKENPGSNVSSIFDSLSKSFDGLTLDKIRNAIKREIAEYIEHRESKKTRGYYVR